MLFPTDGFQLVERGPLRLTRQRSFAEEIRELVRDGLQAAFPDLILPPRRPAPPDPMIRFLAEYSFGLQVTDPRAMVVVNYAV